MGNKFLIVIGGPTAIGKTDIAIQLAKDLNTVILSADSRQVYKELNIGVAKPTEQQLNEVKHYFISHKSILEDYSAYDYQKDVHQLLPELFKTHNYVIMVGGTGFYINAVLNGLNEIPAISDETKEKVENIYKEKGIEFLQQELKEKDFEYYQKVDLNNPARLMRALEVIYETNRPFSDFLNDKLIRKPDYFVPIKIWLNTRRQDLYDRIDERVQKMIENGLEYEARKLYYYRHLHALNTVGYKEWWRFFETRQLTKESVVEQIKRNTRQYAKRQITWFRHQFEGKEIELSFQNSFEENYLKVKKEVELELEQMV